MGEVVPNLKEAALAYAKRGWPIFPCDAAKEPIGALAPNGVLDATTDPARITAWWDKHPNANIGLNVADAGMMLVDIDRYKDGFDEASLATLKLPATLLKAKSPRGGEHLFYAIAKGELVANSVSKLADGVDVRSFHGYVLLAPSRTSDGAYEWTSEGKPAYRTDEMVRLANIAREKSKDRDSWLIEPDLQENVAAAIKWLKGDAKIAIQGRGGDHMAYATAAHMKSFGISQELALDLMWTHWNVRCVPPWDSDEFEHFERKIENGYSYNTSPPGNITPAYRVAKAQLVFKPIERPLPSGRELKAGRFRFADRAGMEHIRPPAWLIYDFIPQGAYALLVGAPGTFKTFVALDVALSVATGAGFPWPGMWGDVVAPGPVLYIAGEGRPSIRDRVTAWERTYIGGKKAPNFFLADPVPLVGGDVEAEWGGFVEGALAASPDGYRLIVLDTVGRAMQGLNENAQEYVSKLTQMATYFQRQLAPGDDEAATVLALHHTGHDNGGRARGSSVFYGDPDTIVLLEREGQNYQVTMSMAQPKGKQKDAPEWERPKVLNLTKVQLTPKASSLVVTKPAVGEARAVAAKAKNDKFVEAITLDLLDKAVVAVLSANPTMAWSTHRLAEAVAMRDNISVGSQMLEKTYLIQLREDKARHAHRCYDPAVSKASAWRFRP